MKVVITHDEVVTAPQYWRGATVENILAMICMSKGLRFRPSFNPTMGDLLPPWRIEEDRTTKTLTITQGEKCQPSQ